MVGESVDGLNGVGDDQAEMIDAYPGDEVGRVLAGATGSATSLEESPGTGPPTG